MSDTLNDKASAYARELANAIFNDHKSIVQLAPAGQEAIIQNERIKAAFAKGFAELDKQEEIRKQAAASMSKISAKFEAVYQNASEQLRGEAAALGSFKGLVEQSVDIASAQKKDADKKPPSPKI